MMKAAAEKSGGATREIVNVQALWGQPFSEEINGTPISKNFRESFNDLAASFVSQFTANKVKRLEVANLFDIRKAKDESLKSYLTRFNNATVQKGLRAGQFSDTLALRRPLSMEEIRVHVEKHIEAKEDQADRLEAKRQPSKLRESRPVIPRGQKGEAKHPIQARPRNNPQNFTPLKKKRTQILCKICHTRLLEFPKEAQIERLIQEGHLGRYALGRNERDRVKLKTNGREAEDEQCRSGQGNTRREERQRESSRSRQRADTWHRGTITTISRRGATTVGAKADATPLPVITFSEKDMRYELARQDEPMVVLVIMTEYKVERVLIDHGSSTNILKLGLSMANLEEFLDTFYGFAGKEVVSVWADHRVARRCYEDSLRVGSQPSQESELTINTLDLDLDPRCQLEHERPLLPEDLKEVQVGPSTAHKTKIDTTLAKEKESCLTLFLSENRDVFAWTSVDMPGIDSGFICHRLSILSGSKPIT
ncbi:hypothetical protein CR513_32485, partial [Mucuna pruriens]